MPVWINEVSPNPPIPTQIDKYTSLSVGSTEGTVQEPVTVVTSLSRKIRFDITTYPDQCGEVIEIDESECCEPGLLSTIEVNDVKMMADPATISIKEATT